MTFPSPDDGAVPEGVTPLAPSDPTELGGHRLLGRIGQGGMGAVFLAEMRSGRRLAIKMIRSEYAHDSEFRARFRREMSAALKVRGRFLATLIDADLDAPAPWIATEYVPGPTLALAVSRGGPLPEADVRALVGHLAEALDAVHRAGLVHRDVKPANVILGDDGPCLIDLGIAQAADATSLTETGAHLGTPQFMAPEQARGDAVSPATDVWALGAVAHFAATGAAAFGVGRPDVMYYRVVHEEPRLDGCPAWLRPFVEACLAKDPAARPSLRAVLDAQPDLPRAAIEPAVEPAVEPAADSLAALAAGATTDVGAAGDTDATRTSGSTGTDDPAGSTGSTDSTRAARTGAPDASTSDDAPPLPDTELRAPSAAGAPATPEAPEAPEAPRRSRRPSRTLALVAAGAVLAAGAGAAVALAWPDGDPGPPGGAAGTQASPTPGADPPADTSTESSGEDASEGDSSEDVGDDTAQRTGGPIDECLVGRWEQTSMTDAWNLLGQRVDVSGWDGRVVVFDASGRETVEYDDADPVTGTTAAGTLVDTYQGTAHYNVSTDGGTLRFEDVDNSGVSVDRELAGMTESYTPPSVAAADVAYECDGATHVQRSVGGSYEARFERVGTGR